MGEMSVILRYGSPKLVGRKISNREVDGHLSLTKFGRGKNKEGLSERQIFLVVVVVVTKDGKEA